MDIKLLQQTLAQGAAIIRSLASGISLEEARIKPDAESWSVLEVICHLCDEEVEDFRAHLDLILNRPADPWTEIDPQGWVTSRKYNERSLADSLDLFLAERVKSLAWLAKLSSPNWESRMTNPMGSLTAGQMLGSWAAHDSLHIRQLNELRYARIVRLARPHDVGYAGGW
jgi:hypothetical protein